MQSPQSFQEGHAPEQLYVYLHIQGSSVLSQKAESAQHPPGGGGFAVHCESSRQAKTLLTERLNTIVSAIKKSINLRIFLIISNNKYTSLFN